MCTEGLDRVEKLQEVGFVLPSDIIDYVVKLENPQALKSFFSDGPVAISQFWKGELQSHLDRLALQPNEMSNTLPLLWHEDAVPHWHGETGTFWSWSTPLAYGGAWSSRHCFVGLTSSSITKNTRNAILQVLAWDLRSLREGVRPTNDHEGHPLVGKRGQLAGAALAMKGAFTYWKGDAEARFMAHEPCLIDPHFLSMFSR